MVGSAVHRETAGDRDDLPGDEPGVVAAKECDGTGQIVRLAQTLNNTGQFAEGEALAREGWALRKKYRPATDSTVANAQSVLGESLPPEPAAREAAGGGLESERRLPTGDGAIKGP
mgnify:CR=1 FL=1